MLCQALYLFFLFLNSDLDVLIRSNQSNLKTQLQMQICFSMKALQKNTLDCFSAGV